ncbi:hypothetical protein ACSQ67_008193 [Phaseolus vulgaris]
MLNCAFWVFYGMPFVHPNSLLVVTINGVGLVFEFVYLAIFFIYATNKGRAKVIKTKSVKYMPFWLSLTNFLNGVCWTTYALIHPFDIYVPFLDEITFCLPLLCIHCCRSRMILEQSLGPVQLLLYGFYYCRGENNDNGVELRTQLRSRLWMLPRS